MSARGRKKHDASRLPERVRDALPADTAEAWTALASHLPPGLYLGGGTAVAVRIGHRQSRDLDFFFHDTSIDLTDLKRVLGRRGDFAVTFEDEGTLKGLFGRTKMEVFDASRLKRLREPERIAGLEVAGLEDLIAMKLKVMAERGEMRDYFDVKEIDERSPLTVEEGIALYLERYGIEPTDQARLQHLYLAMGDLSDVEEDEVLSIGKDELEAWWRKRQAVVFRNTSWFG